MRVSRRMNQLLLLVNLYLSFVAFLVMRTSWMFICILQAATIGEKGSEAVSHGFQKV